MADQASMSRNNGTNHAASPLGVVSNIADFGNDIATLVELQAKLAAYDAKEAAGRATMPLIVLGTGAVLALSSLPVILIGLADVIAANSKISSGSAQLTVGVVALVLAGIAAFIGTRGSLQSLDSFRRSREEFTRNLSWIRTVLVYSGRPGGKPTGVIEIPASSTRSLAGLLVNRKARRASQLNSLPQAVLEKYGIKLAATAWVKHPRGLVDAVDALLAKGVGRIIVGGGDGTLSAVAARVAHSHITLGVLPLGTANDFARTLGIPDDLDSAAAIIAAGNTRLVDLGKANDVHFLNVASIGLSVSATRELSSTLKQRLGSLAYFYAGARAFTLHPTFKLHVQNGPDSIETSAHQLVVGNGRFYGGGVLVSRESSLEDGLLSVYALGTRGRWDLLRTIALLRMGVPIDRPGDCFLQTSTLRVDTRPTLDVDCDGEIRTKTPVTFAVEPKALRVYAPSV